MDEQRSSILDAAETLFLQNGLESTRMIDIAAQAGITGPALLTWHLTQGHAELLAPRWLDIGQLYVGVAGLLNLVAVTDAWGHALRHNDRVDRWRRATEAQAAREPEPLT